MVRYLTDKEIVNRVGEEAELDIECYPNYFLIVIKLSSDGSVIFFEGMNANKRKLKFVLEKYRIVTFNGNGYDYPMMIYYLFGNPKYEREMYEFGGSLIAGTYPSKALSRKGIRNYNLRSNHIDIINVAFGKSSLKTYAGRIYAPSMKDLPYPPETYLSDEEKEVVFFYCINDLDNTRLLKEFLKSDLDLRRRMTLNYGIDLRSKSDAQVAEAVIGAELRLKHGVRINRTDPSFYDNYSFKYQIPDNVNFKTPVLQNILEILKRTEFKLDYKYELAMPEELASLKIPIGNSVYTLGMGGLHSNEKLMFHDYDEDYYLIDRDVASYYPNIILKQKLFPPQLTPAFLKVYQGIVTRRLDAKDKCKEIEKKLKACNYEDEELLQQLSMWETERDGGKISINGSFGKFGSVYSILFAPSLLIQTTVSGQLYLLMLIERLELAGFSVVSGNTDGIVTRLPKERYEEFNRIIARWEKHTQFETEETRYKKYFARDVNSYIAIKEDGSFKGKGFFASSIEVKNDKVKFSLQKNPAGQIIADAVTQYLVNGTPIEDTVNSCDDIRRFLFVRKVEGGACYSDSNSKESIGSVIRWYMRKGEFRRLKYVKSGNKVSGSDGACVMMQLPEAMPDDVDKGYYILQAKKALNKILHKPVQFSLFD